MKKKVLFILTILIMTLSLSSCSIIPASTLEAMFRTDEYTASTTADQGDMVMISRDEYEKYKLFSEMFDIYDAANDSFYVETDRDKMVEYATRGLMAGLDDPYSFYYTPKEYAELWEEDEGKYVGIGVMIQANMETQECTIIRVFEGGPAQEAGVRRGDILYRVGEHGNMTMDETFYASGLHAAEPLAPNKVLCLDNGTEEGVSRAIVYEVNPGSKVARASLCVPFPREFCTRNRGNVTLIRDDSMLFFGSTTGYACVFTDLEGKVLKVIKRTGVSYRSYYFEKIEY